MQETFVVLGCGGTGYALAEPLLRLLLPRAGAELWLADGKAVRSANMHRQFGLTDVGLNKAEALARHVRRLLPAGAGPVVRAVPQYFESGTLTAHREWFDAPRLTVFGCIDNNAARVDVEQLLTRRRDVVYLDGGNEEWHGQATLYRRSRGRALDPLPSEINPELLAHDGRLASRIPCDETTAASPQFVLANMGSAWCMLSLWLALCSADPVRADAHNYASFDSRLPIVKASRRPALRDA